MMIMTPAMPASEAQIAWRCMRSPKSSAASRSANRGATKLSPIASASGSLASPQKKDNKTMPTTTARSACSLSTESVGHERVPADQAALATTVASMLRHSTVL